MASVDLSVAEQIAARGQDAGGAQADAPRKPARAPAAVRPSLLQVLCVSNDASSAPLLTRAFSPDRYVVKTCADVEAMEEALKTLAPDLVLIDLDLGDPALAALKGIRGRPLTSSTPVFALARAGAQQQMVAAMVSGATEITPKPIVPIALAHRVKHALRDHQMFVRWTRDTTRRRHLDAAHPDLSVLVDGQGKVTELLTPGQLPSLPNPKLLVGRLVDDWLPQPEQGALAALCASAIRGSVTRHTEVRIDGSHGATLLDCSVSAAGPGRALLVVREIEARQLGFDRSAGGSGTASRYDVLTGLPNRQSFLQRLKDRMPRQGADGRLAVFRVNINQYAEIGNLLGTAAAEELLRGLTERLLTQTAATAEGAALLGKQAIIGRLDSDALGVMTSGVRNRADCFTVVEILRGLLGRPVIHEGRELRSTYSIGISLAPGNGLDAEGMLRAAAVAAGSATADEGARLYSKTMQVQSLRRLDLENHLRRAISRRELSLHYQPKVDLKTHSIIGFEALLRWNTEEFGAISPLEIIPIAEQTGLIAPMGEWVLEQACSDLGLWRKANFPNLTVAVNVSAEQFHATDMCALAEAALQASGLPADALELELTESCLMRDDKRALVVFGVLRDLGCKLSIDDFGTGYSSLQYLRRLPVHSLKIDRSFVKDLPGDTSALAICRSVITLGRSLGLEVVAEGVETFDQAETVARRGATQAQGYLLAKPMKGADVLPWLARGDWRTTLEDLNSAGITRQIQHLFRDPFEN